MLKVYINIDYIPGGPNKILRSSVQPIPTHYTIFFILYVFRQFFFSKPVFKLFVTSLRL